MENTDKRKKKSKIKYLYIGIGVLILVILVTLLYFVRPRGGEVSTSLRYNAFATFLELVNKSDSGSKDAAIEKQPYNPGKEADPSKKLRKEFSVSEETQDDGLKYYTLAPKSGGSGKSIFYLHGGGYTNEISAFHWQLISKLINKTGSTVIVPIYPLAQAQPYYDTFPMLLKLYNKALTTTAPDHLIVMGDSAGGGLALGLAELLNKEKLPQPSDIILFSPWLDASMSNPDIDDLEKVDPVLSKASLLRAAKLYAGGDDLKNYLLSPIYGDLKSLGKISVYVGTHEIFLPDARKLKAMADEQGIAINYTEYPEMFHAWIIFPIPEADKALDDVIKQVF
ncbi:alpha/beta hydrolase fold domain-containing protein [Paenibacillus agri]|uniref:Alpha/beta hydrolase n=1 Tax=Paenibacillus agri TaxID=2744309 RepID=A0A850F2T1_9BACL|nr:alpha/beta hydrolase [Paenibacillus agri]NUU64331.1 alpha/beta hydrolase [Paenibacillus agri]